MSLLHDVFIAVLYLFGIGVVGFFAVLLYVLIIRVWRERK